MVDDPDFLSFAGGQRAGIAAPIAYIRCAQVLAAVALDIVAVLDAIDFFKCPEGIERRGIGICDGLQAVVLIAAGVRHHLGRRVTAQGVVVDLDDVVLLRTAARDNSDVNGVGK